MPLRSQVLVLAASTPALESVCRGATRIEAPEGALDESGALRVPETIAALAGSERILLITDRELKMPQVGRLFGFADYKHQFAVVSTWAIEDGSETIERRLVNAISHELGHLDGLRHCSTITCVMHQAKAPSDLDTRSDKACGRCPRKRMWWTSPTARMATAALALLLMVGGTKAVFERLVPDLDAPYT